MALIGPTWVSTSWADSAWATGSWGTAAPVVVTPVVTFAGGGFSGVPDKKKSKKKWQLPEDYDPSAPLRTRPQVAPEPWLMEHRQVQEELAREAAAEAQHDTDMMDIVSAYLAHEDDLW